MAEPVVLSDQERAGLAYAANAVTEGKGKAWDAQVALEKAQRDLRIAEERLQARLLAYADAHGLKGNVTLSDDGTKLIGG